MSQFKADILKWTEALRSGRYSQGKHKLQNHSNQHCCLGVACDVFIPVNFRFTLDGRMAGASPVDQGYRTPKWLQHINSNFNEVTKMSLTYLNDQLDFTFDEIADLLEAVYVHEVLA